MPLINDDGSPFNPLATVGKPEGLIVTRDQFSPPIREGGPIQSDPMGQRGTPSFTESLRSSYEQINPLIGPLLKPAEERDYGPEDPEHNPWDTIKDTKYQDHWQHFTGSRNAAETEAIRARVDRELENRRIGEASGLTGFITDLIAGMTDPFVLLPGGAIYRGYRAGSAAVRSAAAVGAAAAGSVALSEIVLHQQQLTRTWQESMLNIGGATVLGGLLGGGASYFSSRALSRAARQIDDDIVRLRTETADISAMTSRVDPQSVGAATSRTVQENVPASAYGLEQLFSFQGPLTRTLASEIRSARDVMTRLAEIPYKLRQNKEGIPTGPAGGSVEGRIKTEGDVALYRASESLHKGFAEYRYGNADAKFAKSRAAFNDMLKPAQGRMNWRDYKSEITKALRSETGKGIEHPIPQVKAAAEAFRKEVFEPFKKEAQKLGLFPEDAEFSFNYVMRRYDINAILNDYARFKQILVDHLKGGQAKARAELAKIEREIAASRTEGDISGDVDALRQQFEAERARVQEARSAQSNIKESMDADREYLDALTQTIQIQQLDMSHAARMARAKEMGFDTSKVWYHGTKKDFSEFTLPGGRKQAGNYRDGPGEADVAIFLSSDPKVASGYASAGSNKGEGSRVIPAYLRMQNPREINLKGELYRDENAELIESSIKRGHDGIIYTYPDGVKEAVVFDPANIRSVNAAFNPQQSGSAKLIDDPVVRILDAERLDVETRIADEKAAERRIRAFHGSPHEFDKFDMSHMGRGEGTQFEGHGLYFSTSEDVAKGYRDIFSRGGDGRLYEVQINIPDDRLAKWFDPVDDQSPAVISALESMPELAVLRSPEFKAYEAADAKVRENRRLINDLRDKKMFDSDELATALDRELILKKEFRVEAAKLVKAAGIKQGSSADFALSAGIFDLDGKLVFNRLYDLVAASPSEASAAFRRAGILGSEYQGGGGAKNIVVYDDSLVEIVSRDGVPVKPQEAQSAKAEMAQEAPQPEPPRPPNTVRFYHGADPGADPNLGGSRWVASTADYARNFRGGQRGKDVWYVDLPKGSPEEIAARAWDEADEAGQTNMVGRYRDGFEIPERLAAQMKRLDQPAEAPRIELDPAVIQAVEGMAARLGIQMPDLRGLDLDAMMEAVTRAIGDMTGMSQQGGKSSADLKTLMSKRDELRYIADASDDELGSIAADTISTITGSPAARGVNPYSAELLEGTSGPLKARTLKIPDEKIVDFLDDDIERIAQQYVRAMAPDVAIVREFGDLNLTEDLKRIQDEANAKMDANPERAADLQTQSVRAQKDLQAVVARLRGTYNIAHDPVSYGPRAAQVAKQANVLRLMGAVLASSISDVPKLLFVHGFRQNADLFGTMIQNLGNLKMAKAEAKELSAGLEFVLSRSGQMWDAFEDMAGHTFGERALRVATNKMGRLTLMDQWNSTFKQLSGIMTMNRVLRASVDLVNGRIKPKELDKLAASGLTHEGVLEEIAAQYQKHGTVYGRLFLPNANEWDDTPMARLAKQSLASAVRREADLTIVTPGQEKPLWTSGTYGSVVAQFRSFQIVSIQRTLIAGLQDMDAAKVSAMAMMISLGMLSEQLKSIIHGKDGKNLPKDMGDWMYVGMANSGILGWLTDADQMAHKVSRGNISLGKFAFGRDAPTARFASQNAIGSLLGPTYGAGADIIQAIGAASAGEVRESDIHAMRRLMPYQNLFYISRALRAFEEGMIDAAGVPRTQRRN